MSVERAMNEGSTWHRLARACPWASMVSIVIPKSIREPGFDHVPRVNLIMQEPSGTISARGRGRYVNITIGILRM